jgi:hypothetical protein
MPTTRRRTARFQQDWMTATHMAWLSGEPYDGERHEWFVYRDLDRDDPAILELDQLDPPRSVPFLMSAVTGRRLWRMFGEEVTAEHVQESPGTRPLRWWQFDAPEPRLRLGGTGTPRHERLADVLELVCGVPAGWVTDGDLQLFRRMGTPLEVPAFDPTDPPTYESVATYLERLGLLLAGERRRLKARDFEPEAVTNILQLEDDDEPEAPQAA